MSAHASPSTRRSSTATSRSVSAPISTLLLSGLACCLCSSAHRGESDHEHVILLVAAYWSWKLGEDLLRGKRKRSKGVPGASSTLASASLGVQSALFPLCLHQVGPFRPTLLLIVCNFAPVSVSRTELSSIIPSVVAASVVLAQQSYDGVLSVLPLLALCAITILGRSIPSTRVPPGTSRSKRMSIIQSASFSISVLVLLWLVNVVSLPTMDDFTTSSSPFSLLLAGLLTRYLPLDRISSTGSIKAAFEQPRHAAMIIGTIVTTQLSALPPTPSRLDLFLVLPLYLVTVYLKSPKSSAHERRPSWSYIPTQIADTTRYSIMSILPASWKPHFQTILLTPTSSRIFYFLLINLAYMAVQMAYGVITNSLGLISDAIHMLFDCLGLGVGLWASVAATWKPDARYTYGYSRVETLSGFANGCFLILISVFITFEAAQRIVNPPEVDTDQLLLVSTIGLLINLLGLYATGGHHHGHSHGDSHDHTHVPVNEKKVDHRHENGHAHGHPRTLAKKSSAHDLRPALGQGNAHRRVSATAIHDNKHEHEHSDSCDHDHHDHEHHHDGHSHSHNHTEDHNHAHDHSHAHHKHSDHDHHGDHDHEHHHHDHSSHGHAHSHNMRGVFLHVLADTLGSVGVIVSTILIRMTGWTVFDPLASLFIAAMILVSVVPLVIDSAKVLCLDVGAVTEKEIRVALSELASVEGLSNYSAPRFWPTCEGEVDGSIHIQLAPIPGDPSKGVSFTPRLARSGDAIYYNADKVVARIEKQLKERISGLTEVIIQVEGSEERSYCGCMTGGA